ncbi:MAG: TetR family transcriptional regulator [Mycobacteriaceae bacterium]|nr:TetR family transcriptional regulator [Mycobacteriaceae bacterium]
MLGTTAGLRERKKQQTRQRIILEALDLCDAQGFEATTVEQIANAADVSPRTINRYFDMKEDIVLGPIEDFGQAVGDALREEPKTGNELRALCDAFLRTVQGSSVDSNNLLSFHRFQQMQRVMDSSPAVAARVMDYSDTKSAAVAQALAERMDTEPGALSVRVIVATWQALSHIAMENCRRLVISGDPVAASAASREALLAAYSEFLRVCTPAAPPAQHDS